MDPSSSQPNIPQSHGSQTVHPSSRRQDNRRVENASRPPIQRLADILNDSSRVAAPPRSGAAIRASQGGPSTQVPPTPFLSSRALPEDSDTEDSTPALLAPILHHDTETSTLSQLRTARFGPTDPEIVRGNIRTSVTHGAPYSTAAHVEHHNPFAQPSIIPGVSQPFRLGAELLVQVNGPTEFNNWEGIRSEIDSFITTKSNRNNNSLVFTWNNHDELRSWITLQSLIDDLTQDPVNIGGVTYRPISSFQRMSFTVSSNFASLGPWDLLNRYRLGNDSINLKEASGLRELSWKGDFALFAKKLLKAPFQNLTVLDVSGSFLSVEDGIGLLHACPRLESARLETLDNSKAENTTDDAGRYNFSPGAPMLFESLKILEIKSNEGLKPIFDKIQWIRLEELTVTLSDRGLVMLHRTFSGLVYIATLHLRGSIPDAVVNNLRSRFNVVRRNDS